MSPEISLQAAAGIAMLATLAGRPTEGPRHFEIGQPGLFFPDRLTPFGESVNCSSIPDIVCPRRRYTIYRVSFEILPPVGG